MEFGIKKRSVLIMNKGKNTNNRSYWPSQYEKYKDAPRKKKKKENDKYHGILEANTIKYHQRSKKRIPLKNKETSAAEKE